MRKFRKDETAVQDAFGLTIPQTLDEACDPKRLALIVYDMQVGILSQVADASSVTSRIAQVLAVARTAGIRVFFTRHMSLPKQAAGVFQLRQAMAWQHVATVEQVHPWFLRDTPGFQITPDLKPSASEVIVDKITMSAFEGTFLNIALRDCGINSVALVGFAMEVGIEPTIRHAADLGYIPIVVVDACGGGNQQARQRSLDALKFTGDAILTETAAFCDVLQQHTPEGRLGRE